MSVTAIVLLVIGVLFFTASFFLPDGKKNDDGNKIVDDRLIKDMVEREVLGARERIEDMVDETVNYSVEKTERQLEKLSNEKIMAVDEYSETVLKRINDNHQEAVFLYDMLNDKGEKLKNSGEELKEKDEELKEKDEELKEKDRLLLEKEEKLKEKDEELKEKEKQAKEAESFVPFMPEKIELLSNDTVEDSVKTEDTVVSFDAALKPSKPRTVKKPVTGKAVKAPIIETKKPMTDEFKGEPDVELHFDKDNDSRKNSNEIIRKMHEEGKSNMAIAKELNLGVGEVKLVIDLFANKK